MLAETRPAKVGKWTEPALRVLRERYLARDGGEVVETPEEMCWRVALSLAAGQAPYGGRQAAGRGIATALFEGMVDGGVGRAHVWTPVTATTPKPSSSWK